jgi:hypothetical protein
VQEDAILPASVALLLYEPTTHWSQFFVVVLWKKPPWHSGLAKVEP